jgi:hypothetical protein
MSQPTTEQEWIQAAQDVIATARDAAKSGIKSKMRSAADDCADFINTRTMACPKDAVDAVAAVQVELSQMIVSDDIGSIKSRTTQIDAYMHDLDRLSQKAEQAADLISFKSAKEVVDNVSGIVKGLQALQKDVDQGDPDTVKSEVADLIDRLQKIQTDFEQLQPGTT